MGFLADPQEIENRSMAIVASLLRRWRDRFTPEEFWVVQRVVHTTGDPSWAQDLVFQDNPVSAGIDAMRRQAPVICDVKMVAAGIRARLPEGTKLWVAVDEPKASADTYPKTTRALRGMRELSEWLSEAIVVVGNAPTALFGVMEVAATGRRPAVVIGTPVGFVGAAEAKEALLHVGVPAVAVRGTKGGSTVAAAIFNAIATMARR